MMDIANMLKLADTIENMEHLNYAGKEPLVRDENYFHLGSTDLEQFTEGMPEFFNMVEFQLVPIEQGSDCGTAGCIAGTAVGLFGVPPGERGQNISFIANLHLGLPSEEAGTLFEPFENYHYSCLPMRYITPKQAADAVRLVATGVTALEAWISVGVMQRHKHLDGYRDPFRQET